MRTQIICDIAAFAGAWTKALRVGRRGHVAVMLVTTLTIGGCQIQMGVYAGLTESDRLIMADATQQALDNNRTGESTNWSNDETGHLGTITPTATRKSSAGEDCRGYQETFTIDGETQRGDGIACRTANGVWETIDLRYARRGDHYDPYGYPYYWYPPYDYWPPDIFYRHHLWFGHHRRYHNRHGATFGFHFGHYF